MNELEISYTDSVQANNDWSRLYAVNFNPVMNLQPVQKETMPDVKGMGLKDALYLLENLHLRVRINGRGKVREQSIAPGTSINKNQVITIELK